MSLEDTDLVELAVQTLVALDSLLRTLSARRQALEILRARLLWEAQREKCWKAYAPLRTDLNEFIPSKGRWKKQEHADSLQTERYPRLSEQPSVQTHSEGSSIKVQSSTLARRCQLFSNELVPLAGRLMDDIIELNQVPDQFLDEQDRLEDLAEQSREEQLFAVQLNLQWNKAEELYHQSQSLKSEVRDASQITSRFSNRTSDLDELDALHGHLDKINGVIQRLTGSDLSNIAANDDIDINALLSHNIGKSTASPTCRVWPDQSHHTNTMIQELCEEFVTSIVGAKEITKALIHLTAAVEHGAISLRNETQAEPSQEIGDEAAVRQSEENAEHHQSRDAMHSNPLADRKIDIQANHPNDPVPFAVREEDGSRNLPQAESNMRDHRSIAIDVAHQEQPATKHITGKSPSIKVNQNGDFSNDQAIHSSVPQTSSIQASNPSQQKGPIAISGNDDVFTGSKTPPPRIARLASRSNTNLGSILRSTSHTSLRSQPPRQSESRRVASDGASLSHSTPSRLPVPSTPLRGKSATRWTTSADARSRTSSQGSMQSEPRYGPTPTSSSRTRKSKYVVNPKSKLDVEIGKIVNQLPIPVDITHASAAPSDGNSRRQQWQDESGCYWVGHPDPKLCFCRILPSQMVMVRIGGGWEELSSYIMKHYTHLTSSENADGNAGQARVGEKKSDPSAVAAASESELGDVASPLPETPVSQSRRDTRSGHHSGEESTPSPETL